MSHSVSRHRLRSGTLSLHVEDAEIPLEELCGFASRRSRKRGFVFVSKVLGKHYPARPGQMQAVHARLAEKLVGVPGPVVFVGMAETAIGLGQGVFEQWLARTRRTDALFLHTTRYRLSAPLALRFEESHSHATEHFLHEPVGADAARLFREAASLVLIDDEISTGRTLANLAAAYRCRASRLEGVTLVCITEWLSDQARSEVAARTGLPTVYRSLLRGTFDFKADPDFDPGSVPAAVGRGEVKDAYLRTNFGRLGVRTPLPFDGADLAVSLRLTPSDRLLVLGTGEFLHAPFLLARGLEEAGHDVHFQSTTRSPLSTGEDLQSVLEIVDNYHDEIPNYLYNVAGRRYDRVLLCYETWPLPAAHRLPDMLGAATRFF